AGSYTDMFRKQKEKNNEKPWYRVYGLKDYRKMQKEVRLGTLGPDLDSDVLKERREKFQRQSDYAKQVMEKNKQDLVHKKPPAFPRPKEENDIMNRRKLAVEYAKSVPKPIIKPQPTEYNNYELASERSPIAKHHRKPGDMVTPSPRLPQKQKEMDLLDIDKLRQRYEEDKQNEALIRRNRSNSLPKGEKFY
ncbi:jhy protein, partial [Biomphalaria glabrata]